jgi:hypothetical protein
MSEQQEPSQPHRRSLTAAGVALIAVGLLIMLPLGLCATTLGIGIAMQATTIEFVIDALFVIGLIIFGGFMIYGAWKTVQQGWNTRK